MTNCWRWMLFSSLVIAVWAAVAPVTAQSYPSRPIRLIVPYPPGGAADNTARVLAPRMGEALGQQMVIDNRSGASGTIGAEIVAKSAPDGYTLLHDASAFTVNPSLRKLPFDPIKDFAPVAMMMRTPNIIVVHPSVPVSTTRDLIDLARAQPGRITMGSSGYGSAPHMAGELFQYMTKVSLLHVPYKGGGLVYADLLGGQLQLFIGSIASALPHVQANKLKGIALTSTNCSKSAPQIPTISESGVPGFEMSTTTMNAIEITQAGGPEVLKLTTRPVPQPVAGQVLIKVAFAGVNRHDCGQRNRGFGPTGATDIPGLECAGEVAAVGAGVTRWKAGDKVCALVNGGGYAQYCIALQEVTFPLPPALI